MANRKPLMTHTGHPLKPREARFIDLYITEATGADAYIKAGFKYGDPKRKDARNIAACRCSDYLRKHPYIGEEIQYRSEQARSENTATMTEILDYFTKVMRGEIKDQFDFDAPLSERTKAAVELAKRLDATHNHKNGGNGEVHIVLDWE